MRPAPPDLTDSQSQGVRGVCGPWSLREGQQSNDHGGNLRLVGSTMTGDGCLHLTGRVQSHRHPGPSRSGDGNRARLRRTHHGPDIVLTEDAFDCDDVGFESSNPVLHRIHDGHEPDPELSGGRRSDDVDLDKAQLLSGRTIDHADPASGEAGVNPEHAHGLQTLLAADNNWTGVRHTNAAERPVTAATRRSWTYGRTVDKDWVAWHDAYDRPGSDLSRRLTAVQGLLRTALDHCERGPIRLLSVCAGDGRDVLQTLAEHPRAADVCAVLVESDKELCRRAAGSTTGGSTAGGASVDIRQADAGDVAAWIDLAPVDVLLACGVFGNLDREQLERCVQTLPVGCHEGTALLWTRGRGPEDPGPDLDRWLTRAGFRSTARVSPERAGYRVGLDRYGGPTVTAEPGQRLFSHFR